MSEHREKAVEAAQDKLRDWGGGWDDDNSLKAATEILKAAEPHLQRMYLEPEEAKRRECEEALASTERDFAEFRETMLKPLQDEGGSIESLPWDKLLGVAVRNANECMKAQDERDRAWERLREAVGTPTHELASTIGRARVHLDANAPALAKRELNGAAEALGWLRTAIDKAQELMEGEDRG